MIKKNKISIVDLERERFSNFVVDLRPIPKKALKNIAKETKSFSKIFITKLAKIKGVVEKIKPNLLLNKPSANFFRTSYKSQLKFKGFKQSPWKVFLKWWPLPPIFKKKSQNFWLQSIKDKELIFSSSPNLNLSWWKKKLFKNLKINNKKDLKKKRIWHHPLLIFVFVLLLIIFLFKFLSQKPLGSFSDWESQITGQSMLAVNNLMSAASFASQLDFKKADVNFQEASANFLAASNNLDKINGTILSLASLSNNPKIKLAAESKKFLNAGILASNLGRYLMLATDSLFNGDKNNFSNTLDNFLLYGHQAVKESQALNTEIKQIDLANLPLDYRTKFISLRDQVSLLSDNLANFVAVGDQLKEVFGLSRDKRYLLVFQNNAELRASGGFLGSYALVDLRDGKIINLEVPGGGSYDTAGGLKVNMSAPEPLWLVNPLWHFWDANWWPDWPKTAQNLMWFYEKSSGPSVDGVISVTPTVIEKLLEVTGPIDLTAEYGVIIDSNNFWETVQTITEQKNLAITNPEIVANLPTSSTPIISDIPLEQNLTVNSDNKPKKIIGDLMAKILETLPQKLNKDSLLKIITLFEESLSEKQILFYFTDPKLEAGVASRNWAGEIQQTAKDYLLVVNTNIAGQKSDRLITEKIAETSVVDKDGSIINTVQITRTHNGIKNTPLTGVRNVDWLRVYVPSGSELLSASGFQSPDPKYLQDKPDPSWETSPLLAAENQAAIDENSGTKIYQENGKTVFANWLMIDPGQSVVITLKYRLPFNFFSQPFNLSRLEKLNNLINPNSLPPIVYSLMVQKQAGASPSEFTSHLVLPDKWSIFWHYPETLNSTQGWEINDKLDADKYYVILLKKDTNF